MRGEHYYAMVRNSNTQYTFSIFLEDLADRLDQENRKWRENTVFLMDNARLHLTQVVKEVIFKKRIPIFTSAPASFHCLPVEMVFAKVKQKFNHTYMDEVEKLHLDERRRKRGEMLHHRVRAIEKAIDMTSSQTIKKCFVS
jgi:hypothetical protein